MTDIEQELNTPFLQKSSLVIHNDALEVWKRMRDHLAQVELPGSYEKNYIKLWHYSQKLQRWIGDLEKQVTIEFVNFNWGNDYRDGNGYFWVFGLFYLYST